MSIFISLVGDQPSAVAGALASWMQAQPVTVSHGVLLATGQVTLFAKQLKAWLHSRYALDCDILNISRSLTTENGLPPPAEAIRNWLSEKGTAAEDLLFNAEAGLKFQVMSIAQVLPERTTFLFPEAERLYSCRFDNGRQQWDTYELVDLGLDTLLGLYNLKPRKGTQQVSEHLQDCLQATNIRLPSGIYRGLSFEGIESSMKLDLAFETRGYLFGLVVIDSGDPRKTLQKAREAQRMHNDLRGLKPRLAVLSKEDAALRRMRTSGYLAINSKTREGHKRLKNWLEGKVPAPGRQEVGNLTVIAPTSTGTTTREHKTTLRGFAELGSYKGTFSRYKGKGGDGPPLAVCLGNDPSATLVSLYTHKPTTAWVFYDVHTPTVVEVKERLRKTSHELPIGELVLVPTDHLGRGIVESLAQRDGSGQQNLRIDITPGTKAQGCMLLRIPGSEIWSLQAHTGQAMCMSTPKPTIQLTPPDLFVQPRMRGGELLNAGKDAKSVESQKHFFWLLARFLAVWVTETPESDRALGERLPNMHCSIGQVRVQQNTVEIQVEQDGEQASARASMQTTGGHWFETLTAAAFLRVGADEIRYRIEWDWPAGDKPTMRSPSPGKKPKKPKKDEIDVLARFQHRFIAISCKAGKNIKNSQARKEIEATANHCMGRFCIPILLRPRVSPKAMEASLKARGGAVLLDIAAIADPKELRDRLHRIFQSRRSLFG